ncbi:MAG: protein archease [Gemmataceae bacterium]
MYEVFEHTADLGLRIRAATLDELFAEAGRALYSVLVSNPESIRPLKQLRVHLQTSDLEYLLLDWLNELLFLFDTQHLVFCQFQVHVEDGSLEAHLGGEPVDSQRHRLDHEVKAVTYHGLKVRRTTDGWLAEVILDI